MIASNFLQKKAVLMFRVIGFLFSALLGSTGYAEAIYTDAPGANWSVSGWAVTSSEQSSPVFQGTESIAVQYTGEWGGFLFERLDGWTPLPISASEFTYITFSVNPGATPSSNLASVVVHLNLDNGTPQPLVNYLPGNSWTANQWQTVRIPLADLNPANANFYRVVIQSQVQATGYGFSIDAVSLDNDSATTQSLTVFGDAMASQWALSPWSGAANIQNQFASSGSAIKVDANTWGGADLDSRDNNWTWFDQPGNGFTHLRFDISAGVTVGAAIGNIEAGLDLGSAIVARMSDYVPSFAPNTWYHVEIPFSVINPNSANFRRVKFQNQSQSNLTFYLDNVELVNSTTAADSVTLDINTSATRTAISPYIYGVNQHDPALHNVGAVRYGGNRFSAYNWENSYSNAGTDYINNNDTFLSDYYQVNGSVPGEVARAGIQRAHDSGAAALITIPIGDWVSADASGPVTSPASSTNPRFFPSVARKPSAPVYPPNLNDGAVYQDELVAYLENQFAGARVQGKQIFYSLDNEPDLWPETHPLLRGGCWDSGCPTPTRATYAELAARGTQFAKMIKDRAPAALTFGPVSYGYNGFRTAQGASDTRFWDPSYIPADPEEKKLDFLAYYLQQMSSAQATDGRRLLDALDVHWYSEARSTLGDVRVLFESASCSTAADLIAARVQAPRSLWDPSYQERSWVANQTDTMNGPIRLIPRLKKIIADNYPGTKIAFTEYNHGCGDHISDAIAEADTLGIFGREGVYAAMFWGIVSDAYPYAAMRMFRDYDGAGSMVGDVAVAAATTDIAKVAVYSMAHTGNDDVVDVVVINRQTNAQPVTVRLTHPVTMSQVNIYQLAGINPAPVPAGTAAVTQNQYLYTAPGMSVTTLVFRR